MKTQVYITVVTCIALSSTAVWGQTPLGTEFTYQGQLRSPGMPAITTADFQFSLFDADTNGNQIGQMLLKANTAVVGGLFSVSLDFGEAAFKGDAQWLKVAVRSPAGTGDFSTLSPRQPVTAAPYALQTRGITVDEIGRVGIGTRSPAKNLSVAGDIEIGLSSSDYHHLRLGGGNGDGFLYGSFPAFGDGIHLSYNHFCDADGNHHFVNSGGGVSRLSMGDGEIKFATAGSGDVPPINRVAIDASGLHVFGGNITISPRLRSYTIHPYAFHRVGGADGSITQTDEGLFVGTSGTIFATSVQLPDGVTVVMLEALGHDGSGGNFQINTRLGRTNFSGEAEEMALASSADGGSVWQDLEIASPVIANGTHSYWVRVNMGGLTTLRAVRILYEITQPLP